jgi:hypothetical protein
MLFRSDKNIHDLLCDICVPLSKVGCNVLRLELTTGATCDCDLNHVCCQYRSRDRRDIQMVEECFQ